jgi:hypothetical protein
MEMVAIYMEMVAIYMEMVAIYMEMVAIYMETTNYNNILPLGINGLDIDKKFTIYITC